MFIFLTTKLRRKNGYKVEGSKNKVYARKQTGILEETLEFVMTNQNPEDRLKPASVFQGCQPWSDGRLARVSWHFSQIPGMGFANAEGTIWLELEKAQTTQAMALHQQGGPADQQHCTWAAAVVWFCNGLHSINMAATHFALLISCRFLSWQSLTQNHTVKEILGSIFLA